MTLGIYRIAEAGAGDLGIAEAREIVAVAAIVGLQAGAGRTLEALQIDHFEVGVDWQSALVVGRIAVKSRRVWGELAGVFAESGKWLEGMTKDCRGNTYWMAFIFDVRARSCPITLMAQDVLVKVLLVINLVRNLTKGFLLR